MVQKLSGRSIKNKEKLSKVMPNGKAKGDVSTQEFQSLHTSCCIVLFFAMCIAVCVCVCVVCVCVCVCVMNIVYRSFA